MRAHTGRVELPIYYSQATPVERAKVRHQYADEQGGLCYHCDMPLDEEPILEFIRRHPINEELFPKGFFDHPVHLHHDHETDLTIGAVHAYCNAVLWEYHNE